MSHKLCFEQCHYMIEEHEEILEQWFFLEYARGLDDDLYTYFCIEKLSGIWM